MKGLKNHIALLWSNATLLKSLKVPLFWVFVLFFVNVNLVTIPNYFGLLNGIRSIDRLAQIEETFVQFYDLELDCRIDENAELTCGTIPDTVNGYKLVVQDEIQTEGIVESTILLGRTQTALIYVDEDDLAYVVAGDYRFLTGFDFALVKTLDHEGTLAEHYASVTDLYLSGIYFSTIGEQLILVFSSQFAQMGIYLVMVSLMFLILNFRTKIKKITYKASVKLVVLAMTGPALLTAVLGVFFTAWASMLFIFVYAVRVLFLYYRAHKAEETLS